MNKKAYDLIEEALGLLSNYDLQIRIKLLAAQWHIVHEGEE